MNLNFKDNIITIDENVNPDFLQLSTQERTMVINIGIIGFLKLKDKYIENINLEQSSIIRKEYEKMIDDLKIDNNYENKNLKNEIKYLNNQNDLKKKEIEEIINKNNSYNLDIQQKNNENITYLKNIMNHEVSIYKNQIEDIKNQQKNILDQKDNQLLEQKNLFSELLQKEKIEKEKLNQQYENSISMFQLVNNSCQKGKIGEIKIEEIIYNSLTGYTIENCSKKPHQGDYHIVKSNIKLLLEIKNYDSERIRTSQIDKFYNDLNYCKQNNININGALFISMNNEIVGKKNIEFEIYNNIPIIYLSSLVSDLDRLFYSITFLEKFINLTKNKNQENQIYLFNFIISKFNLLNDIIDNIESEKKYIDDISLYIKQKSDKYYKEHFKNINSLKDIFNEIENKIEKSNLILDDQEELFLSIEDPNDLSKNMLKNLQQKYLMFKYENNEYSNNDKILVNYNNNNYDNNDNNTNYFDSNNNIDSINISTVIKEDNQFEKMLDFDETTIEIHNYTNNTYDLNQNNNDIYSFSYPNNELLNNWLNTFNWLKKDNQNCLYCNKCETKFKSKYKKSIFTNHEKSKKHLSCIIIS